MSEKVTLAECPVGLFRYGDTLGMKSEYGDNDGRIDAFIVSTGEFFWGPAPQTIKNQRALTVEPISYAALVSALDAQEAAGEGVTEDCWYPVVSALGAAGETDPYTLGKAAVDAVHPAIFAAGERAGLEKAAVWLERESFTNGPATDAAAAIIDRFRTDAPENDAAPTIDVAEFALFDAAKHIATAIRSLKGGTP